jgi:hypothetical protein
MTDSVPFFSARLIFFSCIFLQQTQIGVFLNHVKYNQIPIWDLNMELNKALHEIRLTLRQCEKWKQWQGKLTKLKKKFWKKHTTATFIQMLLVYTRGGRNYM